jgi:hypothetical protein
MVIGLQVLWVSAAILLGGPPLALGQSAGETEPPTSTAETATSSDRCAQPVAHDRCTATCAPEKQIFLPCMAIGATNMAACRAREVARCEVVCARRHCRDEP